jgi:hypothetical protein
MHSQPTDPLERQFRDAELRTRRHWYEDGLAELMIGTLFVVVALFFLAQDLLGRGVAGSRVAASLNLVLMFVVVVACFLGRRFIGRAKERWVYPRTGFVRYARRRSQRWVAGLLGGAIGAMSVALIERAPGAEAWIPAAVGLLIGGFLAWQGRFAGVARLSSLGLVAVAAGLAVSLLNVPSNQSAAAFFGALGAALALSGSITFARFARQAPPPEEP